MGFADSYLRRQNTLLNHLPDLPSAKVDYTVVIPAYRETSLISALNSLRKCILPTGYIEIIVVLNYPENAGEETIKISEETASAVDHWSFTHDIPSFRVKLLKAFNLPAKHAGVGLARKIGMDEALYRYDRLDKPQGLIIGFDADCTCDRNYFQAIEENYKKFPSSTGFNIYFEHPVSGRDYTEKNYAGIIRYELHLRYMIQFLRYAGFPYAFHTIGSAFAVKAEIYSRQGGMNRKKAGEDFYFLQKIFPLGQFREINNTRVIPSPRPSDRVPFGTGAAIKKYIQSENDRWITYHPASYLLLKDFFNGVKHMFKMPPVSVRQFIESAEIPLKTFLIDIDAISSLEEINNNSSTQQTFLKRFFRWFDAFKVIKYLNFANRTFYNYMPVREAVIELLRYERMEVGSNVTEMDLLRIMRITDKNQILFNPHQQ